VDSTFVFSISNGSVFDIVKTSDVTDYETANQSCKATNPPCVTFLIIIYLDVYTLKKYFLTLKASKRCFKKKKNVYVTRYGSPTPPCGPTVLLIIWMGPYWTIWNWNRITKRKKYLDILKQQTTWSFHELGSRVKILKFISYLQYFLLRFMFPIYFLVSLLKVSFLVFVW